MSNHNQTERIILEGRARECHVPEHLIDGLLLYILDGVVPGSCLEAILANDLMDAFGRADEHTARGMKAICTFLYSYAPADCHGSRKRVAVYAERLTAQRLAQKADAP